MSKFVSRFYQALLLLSCMSMLGAFLSVLLSVFAREVHWEIPGLDAYAGYAIACSLFLALPSTLRQGEHIRVTLLLERLPAGARNVFEWTCLSAGFAIALAMSWYGLRLVWVSWITHDISPAADVTPLWLPQIGMALGCTGFALSFAHALVLHWQGGQFIASHTDPICSE